MLCSMTGYGESLYEDHQIRIGFRIKTVNNKALDLSLKLPFDLMYLEPRLRALIKRHLYRGRVDVFCELSLLDADLVPPVALNRTRLNTLLTLAEDMKRVGAVTGALNINTLISMPDLISTRRTGFRLPTSLEDRIEATLGQSIERLIESRAAEAKKLVAVLRAQLSSNRNVLGKLSAIALLRRKELFEHIKKRIQSLVDEFPLDDIRLNQEVVYCADRLDISEELTRLSAHTESMAALLSSERRPLGKELDFMIQEQMREVTTIGNKAKSKEISNFVIDLKTEYEKIREQVQNIE